MNRHQVSYSVAFTASLLKLRSCSQNMITKLTLLARENSAFAPGVVRLLENYILRVPSHLCLPVIYLMDSIAKNVSEPYAALFARNIVHIFLTVLDRTRQDGKIIRALCELRKTWMTVFPATVHAQLDSELSSPSRRWVAETDEEQAKAELRSIQKKLLQDIKNELRALRSKDHSSQKPPAIEKKRKRTDNSTDLEKVKPKRPKN